LVVLDFGCVVEGYCSDMTRTIAIGEPDEQAREVYNIVREAQKRALDALRPGITGRELDAIARDYITAQGYGECFGHGLGHGFGLEVHEAPTASASGEVWLEAGMTITVEPGIYLPGRFGVRIEDCCVVTESGHENLVRATRELVVLK
jgi:Xaa-Pro aminopeptidase